MKAKRSARSRGTIPPALDDHVRIVPLWIPPALVAPAPGIQAAPAPQLSYRGGPLIPAVEVCTVFWGPAWTTAAQQSLVTALNEFFGFIVASPYVDQLSEYDTPGSHIGRGRFVGTATVTAPALGPTVTDTAIRQMLEQQLAGKTSFPAAGPNTVYFVFLPPAVLVAAAPHQPLDQRPDGPPAVRDALLRRQRGLRECQAQFDREKQRVVAESAPAPGSGQDASFTARLDELWLAERRLEVGHDAAVPRGPLCFTDAR